MPVLIERTAKRFKVGMLAGAALLCFGVVAAIAGSPAIGGGSVILGFAIYLGARVLAWWQHG